MSIQMYYAFFKQKEIRNVLICLVLMSLFLFIKSIPSENLYYFQDKYEFQEYADRIKMEYFEKPYDVPLQSLYDTVFSEEELERIAKERPQDISDAEIIKIYEDAMYRLEQAIENQEAMIEANRYVEIIEKILVDYKYIEPRSDTAYFIGDDRKTWLRQYSAKNKIMAYYRENHFLGGAIYYWAELYTMSSGMLSFLGATVLGMMMFFIYLEEQFYQKHLTVVCFIPKKNSAIVRSGINTLTVIGTLLITYLLSYVYMCLRLENGQYFFEFWSGLKTILSIIVSVKMLQLVMIYFLFCYNVLLLLSLTKKIVIRYILLISIVSVYCVTYIQLVISRNASLIHKFNLLLYLDFDKYLTGYRNATLLDFEQFQFYPPHYIIISLLCLSLIFKCLNYCLNQLRKGKLV